MAWQGMRSLGSAPRLGTGGFWDGGPCQLGSHVLWVFGSSLLRGVCLCLPEHVWRERLILDYLEARESLGEG